MIQITDADYYLLQRISGYLTSESAWNNLPDRLNAELMNLLDRTAPPDLREFTRRMEAEHAKRAAGEGKP